MTSETDQRLTRDCTGPQRLYRASETVLGLIKTVRRGLIKTVRRGLIKTVRRGLIKAVGADPIEVSFCIPWDPVSLAQGTLQPVHERA